MDFVVFGAKVKEAREKKGYTQEVLAEKLDLSVQHISVIERGKKTPRLETFIHIANELEVDANYLLEGILDKSPQITSNKLYEKLEKVSDKEQNRILQVVDVLVKTANER